MRKKFGNLEYKTVKGRVAILKATLYKGQKVIIRMIGKDYFEYLIPFNGEVYSSYIIIKPSGKSSKLTDAEIQECASLIYTGAEATIDSLLGEDGVDDKTKEIIDIIEKNRDKIDGK